jgi:hypothetical protein
MAADLDQLIAKMEADLAALKRARELARQYEGRSNGASTNGSGAGSSVESSTWYTFLPDMLREHSMSVRDVETALREQHSIRAPYSTIYAWLKRAAKRGEYTKKGAKYKYRAQQEEGAT